MIRLSVFSVKVIVCPRLRTLLATGEGLARFSELERRFGTILEADASYPVVSSTWRWQGLSTTVPSRIMTRQQVLDLYFMDARCKLIDLAAFLDRVERASGEEDFRMLEFRKAMRELEGKTNRAERVLLALSDPTTEPIPAATTKAACGAYPGGK